MQDPAALRARIAKLQSDLDVLRVSSGEGGGLTDADRSLVRLRETLLSQELHEKQAELAAIEGAPGYQPPPPPDERAAAVAPVAARAAADETHGVGRRAAIIGVLGLLVLGLAVGSLVMSDAFRPPPSGPTAQNGRPAALQPTRPAPTQGIASQPSDAAPVAPEGEGSGIQAGAPAAEPAPAVVEAPAVSEPIPPPVEVAVAPTEVPVVPTVAPTEAPIARVEPTPVPTEPPVVARAEPTPVPTEAPIVRAEPTPAPTEPPVIARQEPPAPPPPPAATMEPATAPQEPSSPPVIARAPQAAPGESAAPSGAEQNRVPPTGGADPGVLAGLLVALLGAGLGLRWVARSKLRA